jgi:hypothetical protein
MPVRRYPRRRKRRTVEAYTNASLMNVRNQLMNKLGDDFEVIGGSTVPKIVVTPDNYKNIQFEIQANGQNVEVTPVIDNIPDYLHKRKGIAFMQAANILYDFIMSMLKSAKTERVSNTMKLTINEHVEDTYFVGVSKKKNPGNTYDELQTFNDEQEAWEFALKWNLRGYYVYWKEHTSMGWNDEIDYDYEDDVFEKTYVPYEMKRFSESVNENYDREIYTPSTSRKIISLGYEDKGDYYIKDYVDCSIQIMKDQGHVTVYSDGGDVVYCPIKYVTNTEELEELDNWAEFGGN